MQLQLDIFGDQAEMPTGAGAADARAGAVWAAPGDPVPAEPISAEPMSAVAEVAAEVVAAAEAVATEVVASAAVVIAAHMRRVVARSSDRIAWLRARSQGVTATDAAKLSTPRSIQTVAMEKTSIRGFSGNAFTDHGRAREPHIASWVHDHFSLSPSDALFHSVPERRHLATPDCISDDGTVLAEIKTTTKAFERIPKSYLRQIWWQQYVLGAERTLFVWEQHQDFVPVGPPRHQWVERDEDEIAALVDRADRLLELLSR